MIGGLRRYSAAVLAAAIVISATFGCEPFMPAGRIDTTKAFVDARTTLRQAVEDKDPETRSHAIEAMATASPKQSGAAFVQALSDSNPAVRFAAAMAIGEARYAPAKDKLVAMARDKKLEPDKRVLCAVIYALHRMGETSFTHALGELLFDPEPEVRANAAMVMGKMGEPSATGPLKTLLGDEQEPAVQLQIHESLALLGDSRSRHFLEAYIKGYFLDLRLAALPALARTDPRRAVYVLQKLLDNDKAPQIRVVAAWQLAELGEVEDAGYNLCLKAAAYPETVMRQAYGWARTPSGVEIKSLQRLAAMSLGSMKRTEAVGTLHRLLGSPDGGVRVAAAMAIIKLLQPMQPVELVAEPPAEQLKPVEEAPAQPKPVVVEFDEPKPAWAPPEPEPVVTEPAEPKPVPAAPEPAEEPKPLEPIRVTEPGEGGALKPLPEEQEPPEAKVVIPKVKMHTAGPKD